MKIMMKKQSFVLLFCVYLVLPFYANTLIITRGPVCCGMGTYLADVIKSSDDSYRSFSQNDIFNNVCYQLLSNIFPYHFEVISRAIDQENIIPAIVYRFMLFKDVSTAIKLDAIEAMDDIRQFLNDPLESESFIAALRLVKNHEEMGKLAYHAAYKHNVVWERRTYSDWTYDTTEIEKLFDRIINVVTYCHPSVMIQKWLEKNDNAMHEKKAFLRRSAKQVLTSFFNIFQPVNSKSQDGVVLLTKNEFDSTIEEVAEYLRMVPLDECAKKELFTSGEFTVEDLFHFKAEMYKKFDFENIDCVALAPILYYDALLSSHEECLQFAQELV